MPYPGNPPLFTNLRWANLPSPSHSPTGTPFLLVPRSPQDGLEGRKLLKITQAVLSCTASSVDCIGSPSACCPLDGAQISPDALGIEMPHRCALLGLRAHPKVRRPTRYPPRLIHSVDGHVQRLQQPLQRRTTRMLRGIAKAEDGMHCMGVSA